MNNQSLIGPGALLASSWAFFSKHWKKLVSIVAVPVVALVLFEVIAIGSAFLGGPVAGVLMIVLGLACMAVIFVLGISMYSALIGAIHLLSTGEGAPVTVIGQYKYGLSLFGSTFLLLLIGGLSIYGSFALLFVPGIAFMTYVMFYLYALVIDGKKGFSAFGASYDLVKGRWWATFGRILLAIAIFVGLILLCELLIASSSSLGVPFVVLGIVLLFAVEIAGGSFVAVYFYQLYMSLKATRGAEIIPSTGIKTWTTVFMVLGALVFVAYMFIIVSFALTDATRRAQNAYRAQMNDPRFQSMIQEALKQQASSSQAVPTIQQ